MASIISILTFIHIAAGIFSLVLFWIPVFAKKGGINHVKLGKLYLKAMWIVVGSAVILSVKNVIIGEPIVAAFLSFLALITANPLWYGIAILKQKKGKSTTFKRNHLWFEIIIVLAGLALIVYGILLEGKGAAVLMFIFGGLGLTNLPNVVRNLRKTESEFNWIKEHLVGMCTSGIAAYTAFFVFGGRAFLESYLTGYWSIVPWVAPTVIGFIGISRAVKKYAPKQKQQTKTLKTKALV